MADPLRVLAAHDKYGLPLAFTKSGRALASGGWDGSMKVWSTQNWEEIGALDGHDQSVNCGAMTPSGLLATGSTDTSVRVWDLIEGECRSILDGHTKTVTAVSAQPKGHLVASGSYDTTVRIWDLDAEEEVAVLEGHDQNVTSVRFLPDGRHLVSAGLGAEIVVWDVEAEEEVARLGGHGTAVAGLARGDDMLWVALHDGAVKGWSTRDWTETTAFDLPGGAHPTGIAYDPEQRRLALTKEKGVLVVGIDGKVLEQHTLTIKGVHLPRFSPDARLLAVGGADGKLRIYRA